MARRRVPEPLYTFRQVEKLLVKGRRRMLKDLQDLGIFLRGKRMSYQEMADWLGCSKVNIWDMLHKRAYSKKRKEKRKKELKRT